MLLTLTLAGPARLMGASAVRTLRFGSLLIGRSPVCDWILPDPDRIVSGRHCRIDTEADRFLLTDLSTNGVFVDGSPDALGAGTRIELRDGQRLQLGDASVLVAIAREAGPDPAAPVPAAAGVPPAGGGLPGLGIPAPVPRPAPGDAPDDPAPVRRPMIDDDWFQPVASPPSRPDPDAGPGASEGGSAPIEAAGRDPGATAGIPDDSGPLAGLDTPALLHAVEVAARGMGPAQRQLFRARLVMVLDRLADDGA